MTIHMKITVFGEHDLSFRTRVHLGPGKFYTVFLINLEVEMNTSMFLPVVYFLGEPG